MESKTNGKLKKLANAFKPLKTPLFLMLITWVIAGAFAIVFFMPYLIVGAWLAFLYAVVCMVINYQEEKEKKKGET